MSLLTNLARTWHATSGKKDFIVLEANPLEDITNTREISAVVLQEGAIGVPRSAHIRTLGNTDDGQRHAGGLARRQPTAQRKDVCASTT